VSQSVSESAEEERTEAYTSALRFESEHIEESLPQLRKREAASIDQRISDVGDEKSESTPTKDDMSSNERAVKGNVVTSSFLSSTSDSPATSVDPSTSASPYTPTPTHPLFQYVTLPVRNAVLFFAMLSMFSVGLAVNDPRQKEALYEQTARTIFASEDLLTTSGTLAAGEYDNALASVASTQAAIKDVIDTSGLSA